MPNQKEPVTHVVHYEYGERLPLAMRAVYRYTLYGISIDIEVDRQSKTATIVEWNGSKGQYVPKEFQFAKRTVEYMDGWIAIFRALEHAVQMAKVELESFEQYELEKAVDMHIAINKINLENESNEESAE